MGKWKDYLFLWILFIMFGFIIVAGSSNEFTNFPNNLGLKGIMSLLMLIVGAWGVFKAGTEK